MKSKSFFIIGIIYSIIFCFCQTKTSPENFDIKGNSTIILKNETRDTLKINIENWYQFPSKAQIIDTILTKGNTIEFAIITQGYNYYKVELDGKIVKVFAKPNAKDKITISDNNQLLYSGTSKKINEFLQKKTKDFDTIDAEWLPRPNLTHGNKTTKELLNKNDSITQIHLNYLEANKNKLPDWFIAFEQQRLRYLTIDWKIKSIWYRRALLNRKDSLPNNFLEVALADLAIDNKVFFGNENYMRFLSSYISLKNGRFYKAKRPTSKEDYKEIYVDNFKTTQRVFQGDLKDLFLTYELGKIIDSKRYVFEEKWINMVESERLNEYLKQLYHSNPILPKGAKLPYFSLLDATNVRYEPRQFKDQIILINFWATWCKPCIEEFPYENELVSQFKEKPVKIINICMESDSTKWKSILDKNQLKPLNLFSKNNWDEKLTRDFDINGLPHSVLVDWNGKIVQNKCPSASRGVDKLIHQLLAKKKED